MEADSSSGANLVRNGKNAFTWLAISRGFPLHCGVAEHRQFHGGHSQSALEYLRVRKSGLWKRPEQSRWA
jgi:hypothetical protein